ncbi:MAG: hypothetical protein ACRYG5_12835 [Janthinobacterium lividum]
MRPLVYRSFTFALLVIAPIAAFAADAASSSPNVTLSVDKDLVTLLKCAVWAGGIFIAVFAFFSVAFFGVDVRKARSALIDAQKETRDLLKELKVDFEAMKDLKEKLEQLGAQLEEGSESNSETDTSNDSANQIPAQSSFSAPTGRSDSDLIREVIQSSTYDWTTIGRVEKRTGLSRDVILEAVRKAPDMEISTGKKTMDFIFRSKSTR